MSVSCFDSLLFCFGRIKPVICSWYFMLHIPCYDGKKSNLSVLVPKLYHPESLPLPLLKRFLPSLSKSVTNRQCLLMSSKVCVCGGDLFRKSVPQSCSIMKTSQAPVDAGWATVNGGIANWLPDDCTWCTGTYRRRKSFRYAGPWRALKVIISIIRYIQIKWGEKRNILLQTLVGIQPKAAMSRSG